MRFLVLFAMLPFAGVDSSPWLTDLDHAVAIAGKTGQPIFIVLSCPH